MTDTQEEITLFRDMVLRFFEQEMTPFYEQWEEDRIVPREFWNKLGAAGMLCVDFPEKYGAAEASFEVNQMIQFEIGRHGFGGFGSGYNIHSNICAGYINNLGTEEQKHALVGPTIRGEMNWCQGYSEPGSGSDLASLSTKAVLDGDHWVINGQKIWTSGAQNADMIFCLVRTEPDAPKHNGISYLIFKMDTPGIEVRPLVTMTGEAIFNETFFTDVRVPKDQIIGKRGEGWFVANTTLKHERGSLGDPNQIENRFRDLVEILKNEKIDGKPLIQYPIYRDRLLRLQGRVLSMKCNGMRILTANAKNKEPGLARWIVKLLGCELNHQMAALAIDAMGELGVLYGESSYLRDYGMWQRNYMLDLGLIIGGGTAQIQKNMIGERALGLPKEPKYQQS